MLLLIIFIILGFTLLILGAQVLIDGAGSLAKRFRVSDIIIGLTIVALGTTSPELVVNIVSSIQGNSDLVLGNIVGSNIANIMLILGLTASISALPIARDTVRREIPFALLGSIVLAVLLNDGFFVAGNRSLLAGGDGIVLLCIFAIFIYYIVETGRSWRSVRPQVIEKISIPRSILFIIGGLLGLGVGGQVVVHNAVELATLWGWSEKLIGLTILALGTSLPELITCVVAVVNKKTSIAIGNIIGANILNTFFILGISAVIHPVVRSNRYTIDMAANIFAHILLFAVLFMGDKHILQRKQGVFFVCLYISFLAYMFFVG